VSTTLRVKDSALVIVLPCYGALEIVGVIIIIIIIMARSCAGANWQIFIVVFNELVQCSA